MLSSNTKKNAAFLMAENLNISRFLYSKYGTLLTH